MLPEGDLSMKKIHDSKPNPTPDGSHLSSSHPMKFLKPGESKMLPLTFMGAGGVGYRTPVPYFPVRKKATMISREEAMANRVKLRS
jgi:hypothetical protein